MSVTLYRIEDSRTGKIRVRCTSDQYQIDQAAEKAAATGKPSVRCQHGGAVCNSYGYPAQTEAVLVVAIPRGAHVMVALYGAQLSANKVTLCGAANACVSGAGLLFDGRANAATKAESLEWLVKEAAAGIGRARDAKSAEKRQRRAAWREWKRPPLAERLLQRKLDFLSRLIGREVAAPSQSGNRWQSGLSRLGTADDPVNRIWQQQPIAVPRSDRGYEEIGFRFPDSRWIFDSALRISGYAPHGDDRDVAAFAAETNQERRRYIVEACGDRVLPEAQRTLIQQDDFGQLWEIKTADDPRVWGGSRTERQVRVVCPSTGAVYWLPVSQYVRTAHEAVASTFGLTTAEYLPAVEA